MFKHIPNKNLSRGKNDPLPNGEKENQQPASSTNVPRIAINSNGNGSVPKRYRSVFTENTALSSFGIRKEDSYPRSRSPLNHHQPNIVQGPLKPVREFLTTPQTQSDQQTDEIRRSTTQMNGFNRAHVEATMQNVDAALARALHKLHPSQSNTRSNHVAIDPAAHRSNSGRTATPFLTGGSHNFNGFYYQQSNGMKGPLPADLITRRPTTGSSFTNNQNRPTVAVNPVQSSSVTVNIRETPRKSEHGDPVSSSNLRSPRKSTETEQNTLNHVRSSENKQPNHIEPTRKFIREGTTNAQQSQRKRSPNHNPTRVERQQHPLPEVSVNPHIEAPVQQNNAQILTIYDHPPQAEIFSTHQHIRVEPTDTIKGVPTILKQMQLADIQPDVVIQHQRASLTSPSKPRVIEQAFVQQNSEQLNEAYIERYDPSTHLVTIQPAKKSHKSDNDSDSITQTNNPNQDSTLTSSPVTEELNDIWNKKNGRHGISDSTNGHRRKTKHRPPGRLEKYHGQSDSEMTTTGLQNMMDRLGPYPSEADSDPWSDLTREFSERKLRKRSEFRTSTPNIDTAQSSSISSKEVGLIRKQLNDLQLMYQDLLKLLDIDIESVRSSSKSNTSSHFNAQSRRGHSRKIAPAVPNHQPSMDIKLEINQRFQRVEASIVTLAESIARLSGQVQMQRTLKEDVHTLREEIVELRQRLHQNQSSQQIPNFVLNDGTPLIGNGSTLPRLIPPHPQRLINPNSTNPLSNSNSLTQSPSITPRANSIIDPRQAKKIEQFFGADAMLRYFLSLLNYEEYAPILEREKIGIYELPYVNERRLQAIGIPYGPCARIIFEAQQYFISLLTLKSNGVDV